MADEFDGVGGSYTVDPKTGKRKLVERTGDTLPVEADKKQPVQPKTDTED